MSIAKAIQDLTLDLCIRYNLPYIKVEFVESNIFYGQYDYHGIIYINKSLVNDILEGKNEYIRKKRFEKLLRVLLHELRHAYQFRYMRTEYIIACQSYNSQKWNTIYIEKDSEQFVEEEIKKLNVEELYKKIF